LVAAFNLAYKDIAAYFLQNCGFKNIRIYGVQRYGLANHIQWLGSGSPGGHKSNMSVFEGIDLYKAYANALARFDANDTLVAICEV